MVAARTSLTPDFRGSESVTAKRRRGKNRLPSEPLIIVSPSTDTRIQKKPPGGQEPRPSSGLAGDFRHLAVVWQASGAPMGVSCLMVKSSELCT